MHPCTAVNKCWESSLCALPCTWTLPSPALSFRIEADNIVSCLLLVFYYALFLYHVLGQNFHVCNSHSLGNIPARDFLLAAKLCVGWQGNPPLYRVRKKSEISLGADSETKMEGEKNTDRDLFQPDNKISFCWYSTYLSQNSKIILANILPTQLKLDGVAPLIADPSRWSSTNRQNPPLQ